MTNPAREALTRAVNRAIDDGAPVYVNIPEIPPKRWKYRGLGRFVVGRYDGENFDIYRGARTLEGARKARREVPHWHAVIYDQGTDSEVER